MTLHGVVFPECWVCGFAVLGSGFENNQFTEMCSGSEAGSVLRLIDFVYHFTLGLRVIKRKKKVHCLG